MTVNEIKISFKSTTHNIVETLAFKKLPFVHKIPLEGVVVTPCYFTLRIVIF